MHVGTKANASSPSRHRPRTFPFRARYAESPHGPIAFFDEGHGPAMIFVHGLGGDFTHFEHVAPPFANSHRIIAIDMPGCGRSAKPTTRVTLDACVESVVAVMRALRISEATLVGHSAGGQVCARVAARYPSRVSRLVLINTAGLRGYAPPLHWAARALFRPGLLARVLPPAAPHILDFVFHARNAYTEKFLVDSTQRPHQPALSELSKVFHDLIPDLMQPTISQDSKHLRMPSLLIWGDRDALVPLDTVRRTVAALPDGRLEVIRGCGHLPIIEHPETTVGLIRRFFASTESGKAAA